VIFILGQKSKRRSAFIFGTEGAGYVGECRWTWVQTVAGAIVMSQQKINENILVRGCTTITEIHLYVRTCMYVYWCSPLLHACGRTYMGPDQKFRIPTACRWTVVRWTDRRSRVGAPCPCDRPHSPGVCAISILERCGVHATRARNL
jgi:hypothetical protein